MLAPRGTECMHFQRRNLLRVETVNHSSAGGLGWQGMRPGANCRLTPALERRGEEPVLPKVCVMGKIPT